VVDDAGGAGLRTLVGGIVPTGLVPMITDGLSWGATEVVGAVTA
jgi:hypothetical protein